MKYYYVYCKDPLEQLFWTVHVRAAKIADAMNWASAKTFGGNAIGLKDFGFMKPADFDHGTVETGMKGM